MQPGPSAVPRALWLVAMLAAVLMAGQALALAYWSSGMPIDRGVIGIEFGDCSPDRFCAVEGVTPSGPGARAGLRPGDGVRFDRFWETGRWLRAGDRSGMTVRHAGHDRHVDLIAAPQPPFFSTSYIIAALALVVINLTALLILARAGRGWTGFFLGCALISYGEPGAGPRSWQNDFGLYVPSAIILAIIWLAGPTLMLLALRRFRWEVTGGRIRWIDRLIWLVALVTGTILIWALADQFNGAPVLAAAEAPVTWLLALTTALTPFVLVTGWREVPAESRTRYRFMAAAVSVLGVNVMGDLAIHVLGNSDYISATWPVFLKMGGLIATAILFAYALLRHRVVDLGFAINRTLVYSALSFVTLIVFGLVEWASEKLLPFESHEASVVVDAGVALALFLVFHHVHDWIERLVERVFFHRWHANDATLQRFLHQSSYIGRGETLIERAAAELRRFAGGAAVAFYRREGGDYRLAAGDPDAASRIDADDPVMVALRADLVMIRDGFAPGGLTLPMLHRAEVTGVILVGPKPGGDPYRTDEEAALTDAARRIGLDLYALRVDELEAANIRLSSRIEAATA